jgi:uncharacterized membrane protein
MTYDKHSLAAARLVDWGMALMQAVQLHIGLALLWALVTLNPAEGLIVLSPTLPAMIVNQLLIWRARWHVRRMRGHVDGLKVRR